MKTTSGQELGLRSQCWPQMAAPPVPAAPLLRPEFLMDVVRHRRHSKPWVGTAGTRGQPAACGLEQAGQAHHLPTALQSAAEPGPRCMPWLGCVMSAACITPDSRNSLGIVRMMERNTLFLRVLRKGSPSCLCAFLTDPEEAEGSCLGCPDRAGETGRGPGWHCHRRGPDNHNHRQAESTNEEIDLEGQECVEVTAFDENPFSQHVVLTPCLLP